MTLSRMYHVIPNSSSICLSTAKINVFKGEDSYNDICKEFESQCSAIESAKKWGSSHSELDNLFGLNTDDYAGFLCTVTSYKNTLILTDVSTQKITDILSEISLVKTASLHIRHKMGKKSPSDPIHLLSMIKNMHKMPLIPKI